MSDTLYNPDEGKLYLPLDVRKEIIEPLKDVRALTQQTDERLSAHIDSHDAAVAAKKAKRDRAVKTVKVAASAIVGAVSLFLTLQQAGAF